MSTVAATMSTAHPTGNPRIFDFTKRKRWADLLITELAEAIILILSVTDGKVLFCGIAVTELLGWRDSDVVDCELTEFMNDEDKAIFRADFYDSIKQGTPMSTYARLKSHAPVSNFLQPARDILFEIQGSAHYDSRNHSECKYFFAMAKPYPSRNTVMLDTFLEYKLENDRLQRRLQDLKTLKAQKGASTSSTGPLTYGAPLRMSISVPPSFSGYSSGLSQAQAVAAATMFDQDNMIQNNSSPTTSNFDQIIYGAPAQGMFTPKPQESEDSLADDGGGSKKKKRKIAASEQRVCMTCGRTDSPEWRKGPRGPKTLCNACGLRWAKLQRKPDDLGDSTAA